MTLSELALAGIASAGAAYLAGPVVAVPARAARNAIRRNAVKILAWTIAVTCAAAVGGAIFGVSRAVNDAVTRPAVVQPVHTYTWHGTDDGVSMTCTLAVDASGGRSLSDCDAA